MKPQLDLIIATEKDFSYPHGIVKCKDGSFFVSDQNGNRIRKLIPQKDGTYLIITVAGSNEGFQDGPASTARFNFVGSLALDDEENLYIADTDNNKIRILSNKGDVSTFLPRSEKGIFRNLYFEDCRTLALDRNSKFLYFMDKTAKLFKIDIKKRSCVATMEHAANSGRPRGLVVDNDNNVYFTSDKDAIIRVDRDLKNPLIIRSNISCLSLLLDRVCRFLYVGTDSSILKIDLHTNTDTYIATFAYSWVTGMVLDGKGFLLFCEYNTSKIHKIKISRHIPWITVKLVWLGFLKNSPLECPLGRLPKEIVRVILEYCFE